MTSTNVEQKSETEQPLNDLKIPVLENTKPKSPFPLRILNKGGKDEETWLSGSELKTDNSSSDDEASPEARRKVGAVPKTRKLKMRSKKKIKINPSTTVNNQKPKYTPKHLSITKIPEDKKIEKNITETVTIDHLTVEETDDVVWRPKRGSITLPGLVSELERVEII